MSNYEYKSQLPLNTNPAGILEGEEVRGSGCSDTTGMGIV